MRIEKLAKRFQPHRDRTHTLKRWCQRLGLRWSLLITMPVEFLLILVFLTGASTLYHRMDPGPLNAKIVSVRGELLTLRVDKKGSTPQLYVVKLPRPVVDD